MTTLLSVHWALVAALWYFVNGLLHSITILARHKGGYDRDLLRLLMDGHVLMLSGAVVFIGWLMMIHKIQYGGILCMVVAGFMLLYCAMIFPFLKSFGTMVISIILIIISIRFCVT
ncbi:MAG TPA: hypothetical protein VGK46_13255 [Saprospiraceae bacterium]|jgi:hypothetical protein